jgi:hypothetical protein
LLLADNYLYSFLGSEGLMNWSSLLRIVACVAFAGVGLPTLESWAAPNWGVDLTNSSITIDASAYADNGQNGFRPNVGAIWYEDVGTAMVFQSNFMASFFGQPADTYDLGAAVNLIGNDIGLNPDFDTSASTVGVIAIDGVGTRILDIYWRVTTSNYHRDLAGEGFLTDSMANVVASIIATIEGVAPGTSIDIGYDWEYLGLAPVDHETPAMEDPTTAAGTLGFSDEQGFGPGNLFGVLFAEPLIGGADSDNDSYNLTTSNTVDPSFLTISLDGLSRTTMVAPGVPPINPFQLDAASSTFNGRLTLILPIPEPSAFLLAAIGLLAFGSRSKR